MPTRQAYVDYQARASAFQVGDRVYPVLSANRAAGGTVVAVWPAIGMVDVQFPHGSSRFPVEDLVIDIGQTIESVVDVQADSIPGGTSTVSVPGGPDRLLKDVRDEYVEDQLTREAKLSTRQAHVGRLVEAFVKKALYWDAPGRKYKMTKAEKGNGCPSCPRCPEIQLQKLIYKRQDGKNERLYGCSGCLFLIRRDDIIGME